MATACEGNLLWELVKPKREPILPSGLQGLDVKSILRNLEITGIKGIFGAMDEGDSLPHLRHLLDVEDVRWRVRGVVKWEIFTCF